MSNFREYGYHCGFAVDQLNKCDTIKNQQNKINQPANQSTARRIRGRAIIFE